jgi:hypothetical protein
VSQPLPAAGEWRARRANHATVFTHAWFEVRAKGPEHPPPPEVCGPLSAVNHTCSKASVRRSDIRNVGESQSTQTTDQQTCAAGDGTAVLSRTP